MSLETIFILFIVIVTIIAILIRISPRDSKQYTFTIVYPDGLIYNSNLVYTTKDYALEVANVIIESAIKDTDLNPEEVFVKIKEIESEL